VSRIAVHGIRDATHGICANATAGASSERGVAQWGRIFVIPDLSRII
jgi:hypothetical protein